MDTKLFDPSRITAMKNALEQHGYHYGHIGDLSDSDFLNLSEKFGKPAMSTRQTKLVKSIRPELPQNANPNTLSSRYGIGGFPFHTDTAHWREPARYLLLYCVSPGSGGRKTLLIDLSRAAICSNEKFILSREVWLVHGIESPFLCNIVNLNSIRPLYRYDQACMKPIIDSHCRAAQIMGRVVQSSPQITISWEAGGLLILDNFRMLHARGTAHVIDIDRHHKRVLTMDS